MPDTSNLVQELFVATGDMEITHATPTPEDKK